MRRCGPRPHHVRRPEADAESTYSSRSAIVYANIIEGRGRNELRITQASTRPVFLTHHPTCIFSILTEVCFRCIDKTECSRASARCVLTETTNNSSIVYVMSAAVTKDFFAAAAVLCVYSKPFS